MWLSEFWDQLISPESALSFLQTLLATLLAVLVAYSIFRRQTEHDRLLAEKQVEVEELARERARRLSAAGRVANSLWSVAAKIEDTTPQKWLAYYQSKQHEGLFEQRIRRSIEPSEAVLGRLTGPETVERLARDLSFSLIFRLAETEDELLDVAIRKLSIVSPLLFEIVSSGFQVAAEELAAWDGDETPRFAELERHCRVMMGRMKEIIDYKMGHLDAAIEIFPEILTDLKWGGYLPAISGPSTEDQKSLPIELNLRVALGRRQPN